MSDTIQTLKGFRDFIGYDAQKRKWLIEEMEKVLLTFGFEPLETPALEYASLLTGKYGEEAEKLIYKFRDRGDREVALRYDQTVPTARVVAQYQHEIVFPYKRYQVQPVWRADKPQKGRYREFFQFDIDIIGSNSVIADAELLAVTYEIYRTLGFDSVKLHINDRALLMDTIRSSDIRENNILSTIQTIDKLDKKTEEEVINELIAKGLEKAQCLRIIEKLKNSALSSSLENIKKAALSFGIPENVLVFQPTLARGLDYYTGLIFEVIIPEYTVGSVAGGGRYDHLIKDLVGIDKPAVGIALGFDRTLEAAEELGKIPPLQKNKVLVSIFSPELMSHSLNIARILRKEGVSTECYSNEYDKLDKQLKYASKKKINHVIIIGPEEASSQSVVIKNMTTGSQEKVSQEALASYFSTQ